ncbi:MAG: hotdog fold thioesterase [Saprospiraceae bacterium]|nr:hotdog fold thioesterase [Saprospiraceae bacterium]MCB9322617.1 hotdog fold thioesterase [Lewinellaceae bacterium]
MIWKHKIDLEVLNSFSSRTMVEHLDIQFISFGDDFITAKMPVDHRTVQPFGLLHGGASAALAETIGSVASSLCVEDITREAPVGIEINASHLSSARSGYVYGTARPIRVGRKIHVWNIEIKDEQERLICVSRLTVAIINHGRVKTQ